MSPPTILVIDDQADLRAMIEMTLVSAGFHVVGAANGREAIRAVAKEKIDLVLTDLLMPERDGLEVMADLRRSRPDLPVIAMSGGGRMPADFYLKVARTFGAKTILEKPFSPEQFLEKIGGVLSDKIP